MRKEFVWGGLLLLVLLLPFGYQCGTRAMAQRELQHERDLAVREGLLLDPAQVSPFPNLPDEENAGTLLKAAHAAYMSGATISPTSNPMRDAKNYAAPGPGYLNRLARDLATARVHVATFQPVLRLAHDASLKPHCDFKRNWSLGAAVLFPELASIKGITKALMLDAAVAALEGNRARAKKQMLTAARLARLIGEEPTAIAELVQVACEAIVLDTLRQIQSRFPNDPYWQDLARPVVEAMGPPIDMHYALKTEAVMNATLLDSYATFASPSKPSISPKPWKLEDLRPDRRAQTEIEILRAYRDLKKALPRDGTDYLAFHAVSAEPLRRIERALYRYAPQAVSLVSAPPGMEDKSIIQQIAEALGRGLARRRLALAFAEALRYRQAHGNYPEMLLLKGKEAIDPLSGKPLKYWKTDSEFRIYSVDVDLTDNGGLERSSSKAVGTGFADLVYKFP